MMHNPDEPGRSALHRLKTVWTQLRSNVADVRSTPQEAKADTSSNMAEVTRDARRLLRIRAWRWRHCYLEAKRLQMEERRNP
jgi:hypothetical protein